MITYSRSRKRIRKEQALARTEEGIAEIHRLIAHADSELKHQLFSAIENYQDTIQSLSRRRDDLIQHHLSPYPKDRSRWEQDNRSKEPDPDRMAFIGRGRIVKFQPNESSTLSNAPFSDQTSASSGPSSSTARGSSMDSVGMPPTLSSANPVSPRDQASGNPSAASRPPTGTPAIETLKPGGQLLRLADGPVITYARTPGLTKQPPIKTCDLSPRTNYRAFWTFEYPLEGQLGLFILRCPLESCASPIFTSHPLVDEKAMVHLRKCRVSFKSEEDLIHRYARQGEQASPSLDLRRSPIHADCSHHLCSF